MALGETVVPPLQGLVFLSIGVGCEWNARTCRLSQGNLQVITQSIILFDALRVLTVTTSPYLIYCYYTLRTDGFFMFRHKLSEILTCSPAAGRSTSDQVLRRSTAKTEQEAQHALLSLHKKPALRQLRLMCRYSFCGFSLIWLYLALFGIYNGYHIAAVRR